MRKLGRKKSFRESMIRNLTTSLLLYEKVDTTSAKAKELRVSAEKIISKAKKGNLNDIRYIYSYLYDKNASRKLLEEIVPRYKKRNSGFVSLFRIGRRNGDDASITRVELIENKVFIDNKDENKKQTLNNKNDKKSPNKKKNDEKSSE